jgi:predicted nucleic acid-binding protein
MAVTVFLDTSVLLAGTVDFGPQSAPAQSIMQAIADDRLSGACTAWHCCLECYSVSTRLPPEYRLSPADAARLLTEEILARMAVHDLPPGNRATLLQLAVQDRIAGGRLYDAHIAAVASAARASVIVTDNRRHFVTALRDGIRVETPAEFLSTFRRTKT